MTTRQDDQIGPVFVGIDRCGIAVRSNQHGAYILERERSHWGDTVHCHKSEYFPTRDAALRKWFSPYAFPGGYPVAFYALAGNDFSTAGDLDGSVWCGDCAKQWYVEQRQQFVRESTDGWEAETRNTNTCDNCYQHIAEPQCVRCYGDLEPENIADGICANCQRDERGPRYYVIAGMYGYMPDYHSHDLLDELGGYGDQAYTLDEAIAAAEDYVTGAYGLTEGYPGATFEKSDDGRVYRVDLEPESPTRLPWYVEVVEAND